VANVGNTSLTEYPAGANGDVKPLATISGAADHRARMSLRARLSW
jgi:hypothetical protein